MTKEHTGQSRKCVGYGHHVVVPIPIKTDLQPLISLALSLACPDHGRVVALLIDMVEPEEHAYRLHQIQPILESLRNDGQPVELVVHSSVSITRGILDATRELRADILLLDARIPAEGGAKLGTIIENIIPISPCPVVLYRPGESESFGRIVVPVLEGYQANSASRLAIALAHRMDVTVEALFMELEKPQDESPYWDETKRLHATRFDPTGEIRVQQKVTQVGEPVEGFLSVAQDDDLAVADINEQAEWEAWLRGDSSLEALRTWPGGFLVNVSKTVILPKSWRGKLRSWLKPTVTQFEGEELERDAEESSYSSLDFLVLIIIAAPET